MAPVGCSVEINVDVGGYSAPGLCRLRLVKAGRPFIAVDWGTTRMRAMLCAPDDVTDAPIESITGPGIARLDRPAADVIFEAISPWVSRFGPVDLLLCGMVGSDLGWRKAPYLECPLDIERIAERLLCFEERDHRVAIVPGLACTNAFGQPDVMRGEEVQVLGWSTLSAPADRSQRLLCLPGTHSKWLSFVDGRITRFTTSPTGELFDLLRRHSVLVGRPNSASEKSFDDGSFSKGLALAQEQRSNLLHVLFSTRSRQMFGAAADEDPASFMSGLLIGADVATALAANGPVEGPVELIGAPELCARFACAIEASGHNASTTEGDKAVHSGFLSIVAANA